MILLTLGPKKQNKRTNITKSRNRVIEMENKQVVARGKGVMGGQNG